MQIGHHGAQKRRMTGEPLRSARLNVLPSNSPNVNAGAGPDAADTCTGTSPISIAAVNASATARPLDRCLDMSHLSRAQWRTCTIPAECKDSLKTGCRDSPAQKHVKAVGVEVTSVELDVTTAGAEFTVTIVALDEVITGTVIVPPPATLIVATPEPTWANWSGEVNPPPLTGVAATTVGAHVFANVEVGMINGALAGPTVVKAGITPTTFPLSEQIVTCTCAGICIGADAGPTARTITAVPWVQVTCAWAAIGTPATAAAVTPTPTSIVSSTLPCLMESPPVLRGPFLSCYIRHSAAIRSLCHPGVTKGYS